MVATTGDGTTGFDDDSHRSGLNVPLPDTILTWGIDLAAHIRAAGNAAFCDGHVDSISYDIDLLVHQNNANRRDRGAPM